VEGSKAIPKQTERNLRNKNDFRNSKGAILSAIENDIYNFDLEQKRAALFIIDGAQRIRGLAGSGKTVILAMKAAIIHLQNPDASILYTYYTKSLHDVVKNLITRFYRQFADRDPNWNKIQIMHAWGGKYLEGVYYNACQINNIPALDLTAAKLKRPTNPFDYACEDITQYNLAIQYDYSLMDEAQDFPPNFYRLCRKITDKNRVVWAYDDFQNILNIELQDEKETFGKDEKGNYFIDFSKRADELQDLILYRCYRNPRKILISAFALGLGVYNLTRSKFLMIQRLENNQHWESLGFLVKKGDSSDGSQMIIERPEQNSSEIKNELLDDDEIIKVQMADSLTDELEYIIESIKADLQKELKPEDITVVCMDNRNVRRYFEHISQELESEGIKCFNLLNVSPNNKFFKMKDHVTLSTIYNAKGNESGSIYIAGIDAVFSNKDDITERNKIFTAMTRSLAWVTLTGVGGSVQHCIDELDLLKKNNYLLQFKQPSEDDVITIKQGIDKKQNLLNKIERMADELSAETGASREEIVEQLKTKLYTKK
jgi:superfamily I DNA and RNA helicase